MTQHRIERLNKARSLLERAISNTEINPVLREMYEDKKRKIDQRLLELTSLPVIKKLLPIDEDDERKKKKKKRKKTDYGMSAALYWGIPYYVGSNEKDPDPPPAPEPDPTPEPSGEAVSESELDKE
jgi:hypothetical protein